MGGRRCCERCGAGISVKTAPARDRISPSLYVTYAACSRARECGPCPDGAVYARREPSGRDGGGGGGGGGGGMYISWSTPAYFRAPSLPALNSTRHRTPPVVRPCRPVRRLLVAGSTPARPPIADHGKRMEAARVSHIKRLARAGSGLTLSHPCHTVSSPAARRVLTRIPPQVPLRRHRRSPHRRRHSNPAPQ